MQPFMTPKTLPEREAVFRKDDPAKEMFLVARGVFSGRECASNSYPPVFLVNWFFLDARTPATMTSEWY